MSPEQLISIWATRLGPSAADIAAMSGLPLPLVGRGLAAPAWPLPPSRTSPRPSTSQLVARTLDLLERRLPIIASDPVGLAPSRRYALVCLNGLLSPSGPIDSLTDLPYPLSAHVRESVLRGAELDETTRARVDGHRARQRPRQIRFRERARELQLCYAGMRPAPD